MNKQSFSFPRACRLTTKAGFSAVFDEQLKMSQGCFLARYKKSQNLFSRLGIIVSKRVIKEATARNTLKRMIRESFRVQKNSMKGMDIVVMVRQGCALSDKKTLQKELDKLWQRLAACCHKAFSSLSKDTDIS